MTLHLAIDIPLANWQLFPISIIIATIANASGIGGGPFFSPLFILFFGLQPHAAIGTTLFTKAFGTTSGAIGYWRRKLVDVQMALKLLMIAVPCALLGAWLSSSIDIRVFQLIFGFGLLFAAYSIFKSPREEERARAGHEAAAYSRRGRQLTQSFDYLISAWEALPLIGAGGFLDGLISSGLGESNDFFLIARSKVPVKTAVATSVFVIAVTTYFSAAFYFLRLAPDISIVLFTVPGVIIGGQLGPMVAQRINPNLLKNWLALLFVMVSFIFVFRALLA